jgi:hypothetical protein
MNKLKRQDLQKIKFLDGKVILLICGGVNSIDTFQKTFHWIFTL